MIVITIIQSGINMIITFTGHRPDKLYGYKIKGNSDYTALANGILEEIRGIIKKEEPSELHFITGGAIGFDQIAYMVAQKVKEKLSIPVTLEIALPFEKQCNKWKKEDIRRHNLQISECDIYTCVDEEEGYDKDDSVDIGEFSAKKMQLRNMYMIDNADVVIAGWNGEKTGGTFNAVKYAKKTKTKIIYVEV